jgi:hypothetical protein
MSVHAASQLAEGQANHPRLLRGACGKIPVRPSGTNLAKNAPPKTRGLRRDPG